MDIRRERDGDYFDLHFLWLIFISIVLSLCWIKYAWGKEMDARLVRLSDEKMAKIYIAPGRSTILNFPVKPTKSILGNKGSFSIEYIENDLALNALSSAARSNLFVYLQGRRYGFDLITTNQRGDSIVLVRDAFEKQMKVRVK